MFVFIIAYIYIYILFVYRFVYYNSEFAFDGAYIPGISIIYAMEMAMINPVYIYVHTMKYPLPGQNDRVTCTLRAIEA